jgi:hypothetical protein
MNVQASPFISSPDSIQIGTRGYNCKQMQMVDILAMVVTMVMMMMVMVMLMIMMMAMMLVVVMIMFLSLDSPLYCGFPF